VVVPLLLVLELVTPCLSPGWPGFKLRYRYGDTIYRIAVVRDESAGAESEHVIDLVDDRREHFVEVRIRAHMPL